MTNEDLDELELFAVFDCDKETARQICHLVDEYKHLSKTVDLAGAYLDDGSFHAELSDAIKKAINDR